MALDFAPAVTLSSAGTAGVTAFSFSLARPLRLAEDLPSLPSLFGEVSAEPGCKIETMAARYTSGTTVCEPCLERGNCSACLSIPAAVTANCARNSAPCDIEIGRAHV